MLKPAHCVSGRVCCNTASGSLCLGAVGKFGFLFQHFCACYVHASVSYRAWRVLVAT